jgi:hypothetical protein
MPYKNAADKQQWEREHREQRNAKRRRGNVAAPMRPVAPRSVPDPGFQKGAISTLNTASGLDQRSLLLGVDYVVLLLVVFVVGLGLVVYFARAHKTTISGQSGRIPERGPKGTLKVVGACIFMVGLITFAALAGSFRGNGADTYDSGQ